MNIDTFKKRSMAERDQLSFQTFFNIPHISGQSEFGFSGDSSILPFIFSGGRILDPEGNYTYDYLANKSFVLSGNINTGSYNYYVDGEYIAEYPKSNAKYNYFYFDTNVSFDVDLNVMSSGQSVTYVYPTEFDKQEGAHQWPNARRAALTSSALPPTAP